MLTMINCCEKYTSYFSSYFTLTTLLCIIKLIDYKVHKLSAKRGGHFYENGLDYRSYSCISNFLSNIRIWSKTRCS